MRIRSTPSASIRLGRAAAAAALMAVLGCGCAITTERALYRVAVQAMQAHAEWPADAAAGPRSEARFYAAKNAACVVVPYAGAGGSGTYTVWLKRIAVRWEPDRCFPTPRNGPPVPDASP